MEQTSSLDQAREQVIVYFNDDDLLDDATTHQDPLAADPGGDGAEDAPHHRQHDGKAEGGQGQWQPRVVLEPA